MQEAHLGETPTKAGMGAPGLTPEKREVEKKVIN